MKTHVFRVQLGTVVAFRQNNRSIREQFMSKFIGTSFLIIGLTVISGCVSTQKIPGLASDVIANTKTDGHISTGIRLYSG